MLDLHSIVLGCRDESKCKDRLFNLIKKAEAEITESISVSPFSEYWSHTINFNSNEELKFVYNAIIKHGLDKLTNLNIEATIGYTFERPRIVFSYRFKEDNAE